MMCYFRIRMPSMPLKPIFRAVFLNSAGGLSNPIELQNLVACSASVVLSLPISVFEL